MKKNEWFASWFDTPYYHILYKHRDFREAEHFITNLLASLNIPSDKTILDLACGRGRHAYFIAKQGYNVTGVDLSPESIAWAKEKYPLSNLEFDVHDMRNTFKEGQFDYVFNFFTSFGYFDSDDDNQMVIDAMQHNLNDKGILVIDFMNANKSMKGIVNKESKEVEGITFNINREVIDGYFVKKIEFEADGEKYSFEERVQALSLADFKSLFEKAKLNLTQVYGNYSLDSYDPEVSDRLIMVLQKDA